MSLPEQTPSDLETALVLSYEHEGRVSSIEDVYHRLDTILTVFDDADQLTDEEQARRQSYARAIIAITGERP